MAKRVPSHSPSACEPKVIEPEMVITPSLYEEQSEVKFTIKEATAKAKLECPDCGKLMSQKTLRHSHGPKCVVEKQQQATREPEVRNVANDMIEYEVQRRLCGKQEKRAARREAMVAKLAENAF